MAMSAAVEKTSAHWVSLSHLRNIGVPPDLEHFLDDFGAHNAARSPMLNKNDKGNLWIFVGKKSRDPAVGGFGRRLGSPGFGGKFIEIHARELARPVIGLHDLQHA